MHSTQLVRAYDMCTVRNKVLHVLLVRSTTIGSVPSKSPFLPNKIQNVDNLLFPPPAHAACKKALAGVHRAATLRP